MSDDAKTHAATVVWYGIVAASVGVGGIWGWPIGALAFSAAMFVTAALYYVKTRGEQK